MFTSGYVVKLLQQPLFLNAFESKFVVFSSILYMESTFFK